MVKRSQRSQLMLILSVLVLLALLLFLLLFRQSQDTKEKTASLPAEQSFPQETNGRSMELYFCPGDGCLTALNSTLAEATSSIHCAFYDLDLPDIIATLRQKSMIMDVSVVIDNENFEDVLNTTPFFFDVRQALMHNKFCIIDGETVVTGSMNPTYNDAARNNNNLLVIPSRLLAKEYEQEFQSFLRGDFGREAKTQQPKLVWNNITIQAYFCPEDECAYHVYEELEKANISVEFMTFSFTHDKIGALLVAKHLSNITVRGIMEKSQNSQFSEYALFQRQHMDVYWDANPKNLHHKVFIIDNETVITGSFNPSQNADKSNDENLIIIKDKALASAYLEEFETLYTPLHSSSLE